MITNPAGTGLVTVWLGRLAQRQSASVTRKRPVVQLHQRPRKTSARSTTDRASGYGPEGWGFKSLRARVVPGRLAQR